MKRLMIFLFCAAVLFGAGNVDSRAQEANLSGINALAGRILPRRSADIVFSIKPSETDTFTYYTKDGKLFIEGNCTNSLAMGLGDYLRNHCNITVTWFARDVVEEPEVLPSVEGKVTRKSLVRDRFFLNYCTHGYTLVWWDWKQWERLIDWFALNGVNMALANTGQEAIWQKVWQKFGLSAEQIREFFTGPAYLPWHRMTNIDSWDGPLPQNWIDSQAMLQKKIVERENELGISPILTSFTGHVPEAFAKLHPEADIHHLSGWGHFPQEYICWYLSPQDTLFSMIQKEFLKVQKEMYGENSHVYGVDPFNEIDPPVWDAQYLADAARSTYEAISESDPDAVWLQMAWTFHHKRKYWTHDLLEPYLTAVPKGRLLLLDYYCDRTELYRKTQCFFGQDFIWSYLGNFGGNTMIAGNFADISEKITRCHNEGGECFKGLGCTLEGLDVNSCMYEYVLDRAWETGGDDDAWFETLADRRLGAVDKNYRMAWQIMQTRIQKELSSNKGSRIYGRPSFDAKTRWTSAQLGYDNSDLLKVWECICRTSPSQSASFRFDCVNIPRQWLENHFSALYLQLLDAYAEKDVEKVREIGAQMKEVMKDIDDILSSDAYFLLGQWVKDARSWGSDCAQKDYFEHDARSLISVWGPKRESLNDYANRALNGMVSTYHSPRWCRFLEELEASLVQGMEFDSQAYEKWSSDFEWDWVDSKHEFLSVPSGDAYEKCKSLFEKYSPYPKAEYHKAGAILMYTPGTELFDGVIHPDAGLYDRYFDIDKAADEHRNYISMLREQGCTVHTVTNTLLSMPHRTLVTLAAASLTYDVSGLPRSAREAQTEYKQQVLDSMSNSDLVRIIINRPTVILKKSGINTGFEARYVHEPLMNMYFLRDQSITTPKGHILCRMNSSQRRPEVDIIEACYEQLGEPAVYRVKGRNSYLEGGDYIPFGTISLIGQGLRTTQEAIDELLENDCFGHDTVVVVRERWKDQYQMHLDTYFNVIDKDLCTMCFNRYDAKDASDINYLTMDMYVRPAGEKAYRLDHAFSGKGFREFLQERGVKIIRISKEDADHYANNFLATDARHIMSVAGQSTALEAEYERNGVSVVWVPLENLIGGYGAAHCMTQVLSRCKPACR